MFVSGIGKDTRDVQRESDVANFRIYFIALNDKI